MSVKVMSWVWEHSQARGADLLVLLAIADHAGDNGGDSWPSQGTLAKRARVARRSVQRSIANLVALGELAVDERQGGTRFTDPRHRSNRYRVLMSEGRHGDASTDSRGDTDDIKGRHPEQQEATSMHLRGDAHVAGIVLDLSLNRPEPSAPQGATSGPCGKCGGDGWLTEDEGKSFAPCPQCGPKRARA